MCEWRWSNSLFRTVCLGSNVFTYDKLMPRFANSLTIGYQYLKIVVIILYPANTVPFTVPDIFENPILLR